MGEGYYLLDIILFAMIAAFLILRLRSVLGRRHDLGGPGQDSFSSKVETGDGEVVRFPGADEDDAALELEPDSPMETGFRQIKRAAPQFDVTEFLAGTRSAFEMIVQAFAEGNRDTLGALLNNEVYENFLHAIRAREAANETLENTVVRIRSIEPIEAYMTGHDAAITIKIISEQINITRGTDGQVVDGNPDAITEITDIWTFSRNTRSSDPNWELIATRSLD